MYSTVLILTIIIVQKGFLNRIKKKSDDFWNHVTEDWSNEAENTDLITGINYIVIYIQIESSSF